MKPVAFDYYRPQSVEDAVRLLSELRENAVVFAGGMTLGPMLNLRIVRPRAVIDISRIETLKRISSGREGVSTGSGVIQNEALASDIVRREVPLLALALPWVGHFQTRNRGTLGGSVAHADPSAEVPLCLTVMGGTVVLRSRKRERRVRADAFFAGALTTERQPDEMIVALEWPRPPADARYAFEEIAQRRGDFALAAAACQLAVDGEGRITALSLGLGGVESRPVVINTQAFVGHPARDVTEDLAEHTAASITPIEDHVASATFRTALARTLVKRVMATQQERVQ